MGIGIQGADVDVALLASLCHSLEGPRPPEHAHSLMHTRIQAREQ